MTYIFDKETVKAWEMERDTKYAIPDPGDNLIEIYEIDTIKDALLLRAEKWESPEHKVLSVDDKIAFGKFEPTVTVSATQPSSSSTTEIKKPLNIQNPNYTELLDNIRALQKQSGDLRKNKKDLKALKETKSEGKAPDLAAINKKELLIGEIEQKLQKSWKKFLEFITKICLSMQGLPLEGNSEIKIQIYKLDFLPDIRLLRFMLAKKEPKIDLELISLICSYLHRKYVE